MSPEIKSLRERLLTLAGALARPIDDPEAVCAELASVSFEAKEYFDAIEQVRQAKQQALAAEGMTAYQMQIQQQISQQTTLPYGHRP